MNKILATILVLILSVFIFFVGGSVIITIDKRVSIYKQYINEKCVVDGNTLKIVDYSIFNKSFTLSNNQTIDYLTVKKQNIIDAD